jgi:hypothetical protein
MNLIRYERYVVIKGKGILGKQIWQEKFLLKLGLAG